MKLKLLSVQNKVNEVKTAAQLKGIEFEESCRRDIEQVSWPN